MSEIRMQRAYQVVREWSLYVRGLLLLMLSVMKWTVVLCTLLDTISRWAARSQPAVHVPSFSIPIISLLRQRFVWIRGRALGRQPWMTRELYRLSFTYLAPFH